MPAIIEPQGPPEPGAPAAPFWRRLAWFWGIALAAAAATAVVAYALKALLPAH
ncbi:MAG: hypothetical protein WDM92_05465 [Caulobacteraceae bacterium]